MVAWVKSASLSSRYKHINISTMKGKMLYPNKWKTYCITYSAYVALHAMRMTYSQIKPYFQVYFDLSTLFLGFLDGLIYISLALGFALRFLVSSKQILLKQYLLFTLISIAGFLVIPIISLSQGIFLTTSVILQKYLPALGLAVFGFFQFAAWPTLLTITNEYFDLKTQGAAMGFWSSNANIGNILGFALTGLILDVFHFEWETAMLTSAVIQIFIALQVFFGVQEKPEEPASLMEEEPQELNVQQDEEQEEDEQHCTNYQNFLDYLSFIKRLWSSPANRLFLVINGLLKSILYGFLLWMPIFLSSQHLSMYISTIPITFNLGTMIGSFVLGSLYEEIECEQTTLGVRIKRNIQKYNLLYSCIIVIFCFLAFYFIRINMSAYFMLSMISGFFLGGTFNMLVGNQVIRIVGNKRKYVNYLSTLSMMANNLVTGVSEVAIGALLNQSTTTAHNDQELFLILMCIAIVSCIVLFIRTKCYSGEKEQEK